jgi:hypothetical protein
VQSLEWSISELAKELASGGWISAVRPSRQPLRLRTFGVEIRFEKSRPGLI